MLFKNTLPPREFLSPSRKPLDKHLPFKLSELSLEEIREVVRTKWKLLEVSQVLSLNKLKATKEKKPKEPKPKKEKVLKPKLPKKTKVKKETVSLTQQELSNLSDI